MKQNQYGEIPIQNDQGVTENFTKGITLDQYLKSQNQELVLNDQQIKKENSMMGELFIEPSQNKARQHNYEIKQTDQDEYQQSRQMTKEGRQNFQNVRMSQVRLSNIEDKINVQQRNSIIILKPLEDKRSSVGPIHSNKNKTDALQKNPSPGKSEVKPAFDMFRSLYGTKLKQSNKIDDQMMHSTFYLKPVLSKKNKKDDKYFQLKNKQQYNEVLNYENMIQTKYDSKKQNPAVNMRIQGIRDKYTQRKKTTSTNKY